LFSPASMSAINLKNIKAVIFDMDGVITNTMPDHYRAWNIAMENENFHITHLEVYGHEGQPGYNFLENMFAKRNIPFNEKRIRSILKKKESVFKKIVKTRYITGARSFLKKLYKRGIALALVTGTARHELHKILPDFLYNLFSVIVTGSDVKKGKPKPEPYLVALKKLKMRPKDALVIENAPFGIRSAKGARLTCLALETSLSKKYLKEADFVFSSFKKLIQKTNL